MATLSALVEATQLLWCGATQEEQQSQLAGETVMIRILTRRKREVRGCEDTRGNKSRTPGGIKSS